MLCTFCQAETGRDWHICNKCADELAPKIIQEVGDGDWGLHSSVEEDDYCSECEIDKTDIPECPGLYCCRTSDGGGHCLECERCSCECHYNETAKFNRFMFLVESEVAHKRFFSKFHEAEDFYDLQLPKDESLTIWLAEAEPSFFFWEPDNVNPAVGYWDYNWDRPDHLDLCKLIYKIK